jgi:glyoxylase-like metal-dependent hydrolase (beta-lactamase superfamily II)
LPAGNGQLVPSEWQPVAGASGAAIFPFIRKIDTISSNSYIITTPDVILLIDPGGLPDQAAQLLRIIETCRSEHERPVFVFLTHAHIDHFIGTRDLPAFAYAENMVFSVQECGAEALNSGDGKLTQGDLLGVTLSPMKTGFPLLTRERGEFPGVPVCISYSNGAEVTVAQDTICAKTEGGLVRERISFGPGPEIEVYHTPGHSPDSICIRVGGLLFIGDILFAANPGIAGLCGWSQEALVHSLSIITAILSEGSVSTVCPGHGRVLAAADAVRILSSVRSDALALANIAELNSERAKETAAYAEDCMDEVNEIFTIIAGRLYYISYVMDELGEPEIAERLASHYDSDAIDELLEAFKDFSDEHHRGENVSIHLALKAGQVIAKLDRGFKKDELARFIDPTLVQRASRLLSDYTTMLRGFCPPSDLAECEISEQIRSLVTGLSVSVNSDEDMLASADDDAVFVEMLLARVGARPLLEDVDLSLDTGNRPILAIADREHFSDLLMYILEELVGTGSRRIVIHAKEKGNEAVVTIAGETIGTPVPEKKKTWHFLERLCSQAGGRLATSNSEGMCRFEVTLGLSPASLPV